MLTECQHYDSARSIWTLWTLLLTRMTTAPRQVMKMMTLTVSYEQQEEYLFP